MGKNIFIIVINIFITFSCCFFVRGCKSPEQRIIYKTDYTVVKQELSSIAKLCGISKVQDMSVTALKSKIRIKLSNPEKFYGKMLSVSEKKDLKAYLCEDKKLFQKIKNYDQFIQKINGHKIIIID